MQGEQLASAAAGHAQPASQLAVLQAIQGLAQPGLQQLRFRDYQLARPRSSLWRHAFNQSVWLNSTVG